ncbi:hypothetical protein K525DRAFT_270868 [Schizophyllum commune Loenen D]|nr:hypothetical protein K525DRAFT_270868 [Schizophyllum commune Loenen D]
MPSVAFNGTNGVNGATNAPPPKGAKPNIAIYTNAKHELFQREIPYPEIGPNDWSAVPVSARPTYISGDQDASAT